MTLKNTVKKGRRLENKIAAAIRQKGLDDKCKRMPRSGAYAHLPEDILTSLNWHIEARNRETIRFWEWWEETKAKTFVGNHPALVLSGNHRPILVTIELDDWLNLLKCEQESINPVRFICAVRKQGMTDPPQDCDWPFCGCDPTASKVLETLGEMDLINEEMA